MTENRQFHTVAVRLGRNDATITLFDMSGKSLGEEHYALPERTQETLEHALLISSVSLLTPISVNYVN